MDTAQLAFEIERRVFNAWPALEVRHLDGWRLRFAGGVTGRANSVWPNEASGAAGVAEKIAAVEHLYREQGLAPRFQITPAAQPADLDDLLAQAGYDRISPTFVQIAQLSDTLQRTTPLRLLPHLVIEGSEEFDEEWFRLYVIAEEVEGYAATMRAAILRKIAQPRLFVQAAVDGAPAAVGLGVIEDGWLGVFCMSTLHGFRRRGAAKAILRALAIWAQMNDATRAYLQVTQPNVTAQMLYASAGFATAYPYHYRVLSLHRDAG
jgi:GNAT superfamily N-acetyltransferase